MWRIECVTSLSESLEPKMTKPTEIVSDCFTDENLSFFQENGYVVERHLLTDPIRQAMLERTKADVQNLVEPIEFEAELQYPGAPESLQAEGGKTARRLKTAHQRDPLFLNFLKSPEILNRLEQILGPTIVMPTAHHNCIMTKLPAYSSDTGWHQDIRYWRFEKRELVTVWCALGNESPENGCLKVIPGSHRKTYEAEQFDEELFLREDLPQNAELIERAVHVPLSAGDVLFFHCRTFHAATRNYSDQPKYSAVFTFHGANNSPLEGSRSAAMPELVLKQG